MEILITIAVGALALRAMSWGTNVRVVRFGDRH